MHRQNMSLVSVMNLMSELGGSNDQASSNAPFLPSSRTVTSNLSSDTSSNAISLRGQPPSPQHTPSPSPSLRDSQPSDNETSSQTHDIYSLEGALNQGQESREFRDRSQPARLPRTRECIVAIRNILRAVRDIESPSGGETGPPSGLNYNDTVLSHVRPMDPLERAVWFYTSITRLTAELNKLV